MSSAIASIKKALVNNGKNLIGWSTKRKIVVFAVDDYGNIRIDSPQARVQLTKAGLNEKNRFDAYDSLETRTDLEILFETLRSVRDGAGRAAVFTPYALPCNINFDKIRREGYTKYYYEKLSQTFEKKEAADPKNYRDAWRLWKQGIEDGLLLPQFHGREHINVPLFEKYLHKKNNELLVQLQHQSFTGLPRDDKRPVDLLAAFDFWKAEEQEQFKSILIDGLNKFEEVFGYRPRNFTPPGYRAHPVLYETLHQNGIHFVDTSLVEYQHEGEGLYSKNINYTGKRKNNLCMMVRNVVFEPCVDLNVDCVSRSIKQIEAAFRWNRPAIISSHRVNFCGHINSSNRSHGIAALKSLLRSIVKKWPEVEFMSACELGSLILTKESKNNRR